VIPNVIVYEFTCHIKVRNYSFPLEYNLTKPVLLLLDHIKRYKPSAKFGDRRDGNQASARTYFYTNEAACEKNMETFLRCIEAVAGYTPSNFNAYVIC
jgi:hypothetical protein